MYFAIKIDGQPYLLNNYRELTAFEHARDHGIYLKHQIVDTVRFSPDAAAKYLEGHYKVDVQVEPSYVTHWLNRLKELINKDISAARVEIGKLIGELTAVPVSQNGQTGLLLTGKPKLDGILGVVTGTSNLNNGGGAQLPQVERVLPEINLFCQAA